MSPAEAGRAADPGILLGSVSVAGSSLDPIPGLILFDRRASLDIGDDPCFRSSKGAQELTGGKQVANSVIPAWQGGPSWLGAGWAALRIVRKLQN